MCGIIGFVGTKIKPPFDPAEATRRLMVGATKQAVMRHFGIVDQRALDGQLSKFLAYLCSLNEQTDEQRAQAGWLKEKGY